MLVILILMYGIVVSSGPAVCGFSSFSLKRHSVKKDPSRCCSTVPLQGPEGGFSSGGGGGGGLMRTRTREKTRGSGCMLPRENFKSKSSEMAKMHLKLPIVT